MVRTDRPKSPLSFQEAKQNKVFEDVVEQIEEAILDGRLKTGDRLPAERELVKLFGTSRGTLREALRVLEQKGLIEIRLGVRGGAVVRPVTPEPVTESLALLIRHQRVSLEHLAEFREGLEANVAALAAQRATPTDREALRQLVADARAELEQGPEHYKQFMRVDSLFHTEVGRIAGNPVYAWILATIHANIERFFDRKLPRTAPLLDENLQDLHEIAEAVAQGDAARARERAIRHVRRFCGIMAEEDPPASD